MIRIAVRRLAPALAVLLVALGCSAAAAQAVTPSYGVTADTAALTPVDPVTSDVALADGVDDATAPVTAPFAVSLYGVSNTQLTVGSNGYVGIGGTTADANGGDDDFDFGTPVIAPYFTDLGTGDDGGVRTETRGAFPSRSFVIQWDVVECCSGPTTAEFQVIFNEGSDQDVQVLYGGTMAGSGWVGAKLDPNEFVRPGIDGQAYPADGTRLTYSPSIQHLTAAVPARDDATPTIAGTTDDLTEDVNLDIYSGTDLTVAPALSTTATPDAITGEYETTTATLAAGAYTVVASQPIDGHGKTHEAFVVDTAAPSGLTLATGPPARGDDATPTFGGARGIATGDQAPDVEIYDGSTVSGSPDEVIAATGSPTYTATSTGLDDGTYTARAVQLDDIGHESDSAPLTFTVDTAGAEPFFARTPPRDNGTPFFSGVGDTQTGDDATVTVEVHAGPSAAGTLVQSYPGTTLDVDARFVVQATALPEGQYTAVVFQGDDVGNPDGTDSYTFTVDATAPTITVAGPADGAQTAETTPLFSGTATAATGDDPSVGVTIYAAADTTGEPVAFVDATVAGDGSWSARPNVALPVGTYTFYAYQYDDVGNSDTVTRTLTVVAPPAAAPAPAPAVVVPPAAAPAPAPKPATVCKGTKVVHQKLTRPSGTRLRVTAMLNGHKLKATINRKSITITVDLRGKAKGTYKLKVASTRRQATGKHKTITSSRTFTYKVCL